MRRLALLLPGAPNQRHWWRWLKRAHNVGKWQLPVLMLMLITLLNDGALISIGYDIVRPSPASSHVPRSSVSWDFYVPMADSGAMEYRFRLHCLQRAWSGGLRFVATVALGKPPSPKHFKNSENFIPVLAVFSE